MRFVVKTLQAVILLTLVSLLLSAGGWAQSEEQQSLGDVARKERAKKAPKTITNEDLPQGTATSGSESASSASDTASAKEESKEETAEAKEGQGTAAAEGEEPAMTKEQEADEAKRKLEALQHDEAATEKGIAHLEEMLAKETSESRRELYSNAIKQAQQNLPEIQKQRAEAEKELAEKEAAKAKQQNQPQAQPPQ